MELSSDGAYDTSKRVKSEDDVSDYHHGLPRHGEPSRESRPTAEDKENSPTVAPARRRSIFFSRLKKQPSLVDKREKAQSGEAGKSTIRNRSHHERKPLTSSELDPAPKEEPVTPVQRAVQNLHL